MGICTATPLPTFAHYFVFVVPFLVILAIAGMQCLPPNRRAIGAVSLSIFVIASLGHTLSSERDSYRCIQMEAIARKVNDVTASGAQILADEQIYFLARRIPPSGMEHENSHKTISLTPEFRAALHIIK